MKIAVFGAGAIGTWFAARLCPDHTVSLVARGAQLDTIRRSGILVDDSKGTVQVRPHTVTGDAREIGEVDAVLLAVKTWQVFEAGRELQPLIAPHTRVLTLQNGVEAPDQLADAIGAEHVIAGVCRIVVFLTAPGRVQMGGIPPSILLSERSPSPATAALIEALQAAGVAVNAVDRIEPALWEKLLFIAAVSGVGAVTRSSVGEIREPPARQLVMAAMSEVASIARALGISVDPEAVERTVAFLDEMPANSTASMQRDIADGKPSELEAILGAPVRLAETAKVAVPTLRFLYASLLPQERRARAARL